MKKQRLVTERSRSEEPKLFETISKNKTVLKQFPELDT